MSPYSLTRRRSKATCPWMTIRTTSPLSVDRPRSDEGILRQSLPVVGSARTDVLYE